MRVNPERGWFPRFVAAATAITLVLPARTLPAQGVPAAAPSTRATASVALSLADAGDQSEPLAIRVDYGQPHLRGRTLHTGDLVPYDSVWRTGANAPTTLHSDVPLTIGSTRLAPGTYSLLTLPTRTGWTLILQRDGAPPANEYDRSFDVARVTMRRTTLAVPIESLSMWLIPGTGDANTRGELRLAWGTMQLSVDWGVAR